MIDPAAVVITLAAFLLAVVVLTMLSAMYSRRLKFKERQLELAAAQATPATGPDAARIEQMEARLRVLERIATDRGADLAREIEDLREAAPRHLALEGELN
jgi:hypothetical protein